jgi:ferredoxin-thioredoxin reductase catalytic subunit
MLRCLIEVGECLGYVQCVRRLAYTETNEVSALWVTCGGDLEVSRACYCEVRCEWT